MSGSIPSVASDDAPGVFDPAIPERLNVVLALLSAATAVALLWLVSHTDRLVVRLAGAMAFSYVNNTLFSLLHEAVHGVFHRSPRVNALFGRWLAAFFPTAFTLQRFFHLGHHRRNRSPAERFDYLGAGENAFLKNVQWYGILTGVYWLFPPLSCVMFFLSPRLFSSGCIHAETAQWSRQSGAFAMAEDVDTLPAGLVRLEILFSAAWQAALVWTLRLNLGGWLLCYAAFGINWSSLQYADHAWSPLDPVEGAWNLRVNPVVRRLFLNYHHHLAHHQHPGVPWIHLGRFVDDSQPRPAFWRVYVSMWRGPRALPKDAP
jgi:fatty acid desaturase